MENDISPLLAPLKETPLWPLPENIHNSSPLKNVLPTPMYNKNLDVLYRFVLFNHFQFPVFKHVKCR